MGTKQIQMEFQVVADDGISAQVTITAGGTQVFSGPLAQTVAVMPGQVHPDATPFSVVEFDLTVPDLPDPLVFPNPPAQFYYRNWTTPVDMTIAVTGGSITLQETEANYTVTVLYNPPVTGEGKPPPAPAGTPQPGDAATFYTLWLANQPVWTPEPADALDRFNYSDNNNTGPGSLLVLDGESVAYQVAVTLYSA
jgi:hypothetical protein